MANKLKKVVDRKLPVLDKGFVRLVDTMGDDSAIVQAARVSYGKGTKSVREDRGLIRYLMRNRHTSPLEMCEIKLHLKMPLFVARQWVRHRTANINEYSARYSVMENEFFVPDEDDVGVQSANSKQARDTTVSQASADSFIFELEETCTDAFTTYETALVDGVPRELARIGLPLNTYTEFYWKIDLHNLLHFLHLRVHPHAQKEIRDYAETILEEIVRVWVPVSYEAFCDYYLNAFNLSAQQIDLLKSLVDSDRLQALEVGERVGMSNRELRELQDLLA